MGKKSALHYLKTVGIWRGGRLQLIAAIHPRFFARGRVRFFFFLFALHCLSFLSARPSPVIPPVSCKPHVSKMSKYSAEQRTADSFPPWQPRGSINYAMALSFLFLLFSFFFPSSRRERHRLYKVTKSPGSGKNMKIIRSRAVGFFFFFRPTDAIMC